MIKMKLKQLLKVIDYLTSIRIFTNEEPEEPVYDGIAMDIPWYLVEYEIGRPDKDGDEPIYIYKDDDKNDAVMVINVLAE